MHNFSDSLDVDVNRVQKYSICDDTFSITVSAPGKVILFGEHSVVYGKLALAASLGLRTKLTFIENRPSEIGNNKININLNAVNLMHCYDLEDLQLNLFRKNSGILKNIALDKPEMANHENLVVVIDEFIQKNRGSLPLSQIQHQALFSLFYLLIVMVGTSSINLKPFDLTIQSDLTLNAGLGSSASYMVCIAATFLEYVKFKNSKTENKTGQGCVKASSSNTFSKKDLELISRWAFSAEKIIHGTPSGLDNTICTYGSVVEYRRNSCLKTVELHHKLQILLVNTKVPKDTKALLAKVSTLKQNYPKIVDSILSTMEHISNTALQDFLKLDEVSSSSKISLEECQQQIGEIYKHIGGLVDFNQNLLRSLQVSHPLLDEICAILAEDGLHGKLTGAGGGGYAFAIIPSGFDKTILGKVMEKLNTYGYHTALTDLGGPGLIFS